MTDLMAPYQLMTPARLKLRQFDHPGLPAGHPLQRHVLCRLRRDDWRPGSIVPAQP